MCVLCGITRKNEYDKLNMKNHHGLCKQSSMVFFLFVLIGFTQLSSKLLSQDKHIFVF